MKLVLTTGFSGGHIYPAVAFGQHYIREHPDTEIVYVASQRARDKHAYFAHVMHTKLYYFPDAPFSLKACVKCVWVTLQCLRDSFRMLRAEKPDVVIGFGSYLSFPVVVAARLLGITTIIHEQNSIYGKANRLLTGFADRITTSFRETDPRAICIGNLLRDELLDIAARAQIDNRSSHEDALFTVLVLGGSHGASYLNTLIIDVVGVMRPEIRVRMKIILIAGEHDYARAKSAFANMNISHLVFSFTEDIALLYERADMLIARAGAGVVFEALAFGVPAVYIPYPHASSHQRLNVRYAERAGAAVVCEQNAVTPVMMSDMIESFMHDEKRLLRMREQALALRMLDGCERMRQIVLDTQKEG